MVGTAVGAVRAAAVGGAVKVPVQPVSYRTFGAIMAVKRLVEEIVVEIVEIVVGIVAEIVERTVVVVAEVEEVGEVGVGS